MAAWHPVLVVSVLLILIVAAGCFDTSTDSPPIPTMSTLPIPGVTPPPSRVLQSNGDVIGQGTPGGIIDTLTFTISLTDLSKTVNLEKLGIIYADVVRTETLLPVDGYWGEPPQGRWSIVRMVNESGGPNNLLEHDEQIVLRINPKAPIVPTQLISIQVKPAEGSSLTIRSTAPKTIRAENILLPV